MASNETSYVRHAEGLDDLVVSAEAKAALLVLVRHGDNIYAASAALTILRQEGNRLYREINQPDSKFHAEVALASGGWAVKGLKP